jgi:peptidyl-tRNA hydrolase
MPRQPLFAGLVVDEYDRPVETAYVGDEPCYVVNDAGFRRHILSEQVDRAVLEMMRSQISGNENELGEQAAKMLGQDDIFSKAMLQSQLKNISQQFETLMQVGIPEDARAYLGMAGFKIVINVHGEVVRFNQPTAIDDGDGGDE